MFEFQCLVLYRNQEWGICIVEGRSLYLYLMQITLGTTRYVIFLHFPKKKQQKKQPEIGSCTYLIFVITYCISIGVASLYKNAQLNLFLEWLLSWKLVITHHNTISQHLLIIIIIIDY